MTAFAGQAGILTRQRASQVAGLAAIVIAAAGLIGWWFELPLLSSWEAGYAAIKPLTALCLAALGLALMYPDNVRLARVVGLAVAAVAVLDLGLLVFGPELDAGILQRSTNGAAASFVLPHATAVGLVLAGAALALSGFERYRLAAIALGSLTGAITIFILLGYLSGIDALYGSTSIRFTALPTVVGLLCIACGIVARSGATPALRTPRPLQRLLILVGCASIVPLVLFGAYAGTRLANAQLDQIREELMSDARILSADVDREVTGEIETLLALAASPSLRQGDFAEFQRQAEAPLTFRQSGSIALVDRNMQQRVNTWVTFGTSLSKTAIPEAVERAFTTGKPQISGLFTAVVTKQLTYGIVVPVQIDGENRYALIRAPDHEALARVVAANELPPGRQATVSDPEHNIIAQSGRSDAVMGVKLPRAQWHRAGPDGVFEFNDSEERPSLGAYARSELTGWETAVWASRAMLEAPLRTLWRTLGWMALLAFTLVVALGLWLGRTVSLSVGRAVRTAIAWGEGGSLSLHGTPVAEFNTLLTELQNAATKRQTAEGLVRDSEQRLRFALDAAQLGWWQYDPRHRVVSGDTRFREIFDVADHEAAIEEIVKRVHPDDAARMRAAFEASLDPADPRPLAIAFRVLRVDGEIRWLDAHGLAYFDGDGRGRQIASVVGTIGDITERKEHEEKADLLTRELHHRARNMLSIVDAIAHQIAAGHPEDFVQRFSDRIQALAANQDLLIKDEWRGVELGDLVRAQLAHFADLIGPRITLQGPKLRLRGASAQAIGLALHELASNAAIFGALSTNDGHVDIRWGLDGDTLTMSWTESGGPPVSPPKKRRFGTIIMEAMAARSLNGSVQLDYPPAGVIWRLTCPAASTLEPGGM